MGQKVSPTGLRIGINKDWESKWYAENDFAKYLNNDYKIRKYLNKKFKNANISKIIIERNAKRCEIFHFSSWQWLFHVRRMEGLPRCSRCTTLFLMLQSMS